MATCSVCLGNPLATDGEQQMKLCVHCADAYGVRPMAPSRRPPRPCGQCNGMEFVRAIPRQLARRTSAMAVTYQHEYQTEPIAGPLALDPRKPYGFLEMFICRKCGFVEWYCANPEDIPVGPQFMTEIVDYRSDSPYR